MRMLIMVLLALGACGDRLPVKLEMCDASGSKQCEVVARFKDFDRCKFYVKYLQALCDSASRPGYATCDFTQKPTLYTANCTK